ncbi:M12 family metallopeptidase [Pedobacter sp. MC2016-05]|uniref:M12 family metallopeptidase n=1 Tax=Pedobacter sp. MC2016-05 TaxID=2994474 RepID=UPI0022456F1E|nr:M12 family metallopeptidase [Pedobacter sp. MC2016-05]MCX2473753.1 M12 family metallopeptidase [Pedobacter sp. MC2016-05]
MKRSTKTLLVLTLAAAVVFNMTSCKKEVKIGGEETITTSKKIGDITVHRFDLDGNTIYINEKGGQYWYSDDMLLTQEQFNIIKNKSNKSLSTTERSIIVKDLATLWPNATVYYDMSVLGNDTAATMKAMRTISSYSPVRFVQRTTQANYLKFITTAGNSSWVGVIGGAQNFSIYNNNASTVMHEMYHALDMEHEQCRVSRDNDIIVHYENLAESSYHNFNKFTLSTHTDVDAFDFGSIMLYDAYSGSTNGQPTITKLDGSTYLRAVNTINPSPTDIKALNQLYPGFNYVGLPANTNYEIATVLDPTKVFNVSGGLTADGTPVIIYTDQNTNNARWTLTKNTDGYYRMSPVSAPTKALTVIGSGVENNTKLEIATYTGAYSQQFNILKTEGGYTIAPRHVPSKMLDIPNSVTTNSTKPGIYSYNGVTTKNFSLGPIKGSYQI